MSISCVPKTQESELSFSNSSKTDDSSSNDTDIGFSREQSIAAFSATVYPIVNVENRCFACHGEAKINSPYFAQNTIESAYDAVLNAQKVDFKNPENSRLYKRLKDDKHNCWSDCDENAGEMLDAIKEWAEVANRKPETEGIKTKSIGFPQTKGRPAQTEYGTVMLQAEQSVDGVLQGRFKIAGDSKAIGGEYITGGLPSANPLTDAIRTATIELKNNNCDPWLDSDTKLMDTRNGAYRIREQATHLSSGRNVDKNGNDVKDGYSPYSTAVRFNIVRPDKRIQFAKMLRDKDFASINNVILREGGFDNGDSRAQVAPALEGNMIRRGAYRILPHFLEKDDIMDDGKFKTGDFVDDKGQTRNLYELFAPSYYAPEPEVVYRMMDDKHRQEIVYRSLKLAIKDYFYKENNDPKTYPSLTYFKTFGFDMIDALDLKIDISLQNCTDGDKQCTGGKRYEVTNPSNQPLTFDNALDWLKLNASETGFVSSNENDSEAFRRIDLYVYPFVDQTDRTTRNEFTKTFRSGESGAYKDIESFSNISSVTIDLDYKGTSNIDLAGFFDGGGEGVSKVDSIQNFQTHLQPVLRSNRCIDCHGDTNSQGPRFAQLSPEASWQILMDRNLINFESPSESFRKAVNSNAMNLVHRCNNSSDPKYNCNFDSSLDQAIINAISSWKNDNDFDASNNVDAKFREFSLKERTPGRASYKVNFTQAGNYNIWLKLKNANNQSNIRVRVLDDMGGYISVYKGLKSPTRQSGYCINYNAGENTEWRWFTPGRNAELENLDSLGKLKLKSGSENEFRTLPDERLYWRIPRPGLYTVELIEINPGMRIDLLAIDRVDNFEVDALDFQPDLRTFDEANISSYERNVLKYDVSKLVGTPKNTSFFEIEIKEKFDGQNYIFRNPRFISPSSNLKVTNIKSFINDQFSFTDTTYTKINYTVGADRVLTYAPLVALSYNGKYSDKFGFSFDVLKKSSDSLSDIDPKGSVSKSIEGRKCKNLDLFVKTVKPILKQARLMRKDEYSDYVDDFPGDRRGDARIPTMYQCISCHTQDHPYFKMTTFENDELLCEQALSRVDFGNYFQSLIIRGINGTYNHPKLHFMEELVFKKETASSDFSSFSLKPTSNDDFSEFRAFVAKQHALNSSYIENKALKPDGNYESSGIVSKWTSNHFDVYTKEDIGINTTNYDSLSTKQKKMANFVGQFKRASYKRIPELENMVYYDPFIHDELVGDILSEKDNVSTGVFNDRAYSMYSTMSVSNKVDSEDSDFSWTRYLDPLRSNFSAELRVRKDGSNHIMTQDGKKLFNLPNSMTTDSDVEEEFERVKQKHRMAIIRWIRAEDNAR